jgi:hypothetical protein
MNTQGWHCQGCNQHVYFPHYCNMNQYIPNPSTYQYPPFSPTDQQLMEMLSLLSKQVQEILDLLKTQREVGKIVPRGY